MTRLVDRISVGGRHVAASLAAAALVAGCSGATEPKRPAGGAPAGGAPGAGGAGIEAVPAPRSRPAALPVRELTARMRPDVLVTAPQALAPEVVTQLSALAPQGGAVAYRSGDVRVAGKPTRTVGIDPSSFRAFAAEGTAEATAVWQAIARGELVVAHEPAAALGLGLGKDVPAAGAGEPAALRLGAIATAGVPGADALVDDATATRLGLPAANAVLLAAGPGVDPQALADRVRAITGPSAAVDLLTPPASSPVAFLTGTKASKAFGSFSYRYLPDGTIQPDDDWVAQNIATETLPIMGSVTCHRLMLPQLRGALEDVVKAGLASTLHTYDGCYVPRFIERNPENSISLHTWGIAIDMDAATNYRGIAGTMHPEVVAIFKRWGLRWGGDWKYTDPMHFELGAVLPEGKR